MVIASGRREVRKSTNCTEAVSTLGNRLTSDGDGERKSGKLEGNHFDPEQGVVRLERLVAAGGGSWGRGATGKRVRDLEGGNPAWGEAFIGSVLIAVWLLFPRR